MKCAGLKSIVQIHAEPEIVDLAKMFPGITIICSHIGEPEFLKQLAKFDNVFLDISGMAGGLIIGRLEKAVEILGTNRLLFGSDFTCYDPQAFVAGVKKAIPDLKGQKDVFHNNILRLFDALV